MIRDEYIFSCRIFSIIFPTVRTADI